MVSFVWLYCVNVCALKSNWKYNYTNTPLDLKYFTRVLCVQFELENAVANKLLFLERWNVTENVI